MVYAEYIGLAILTVFLSVQLSKCVDALDKKSDLSGAFIGGVMLAAVTSLPELFTSITSILVLDKPQLVQGNVLGSNIFNVAIYGLLAVLFTKALNQSQIAKTQKTTLWFCVLMALSVIFGLYYDISIPLGFISLSPVSIVVLIIYIINTKATKGDDSGEENEGDVDLTIPQILVRFVIYAVLLVIVSILLTKVTDKLSEVLNLGATVAGAIFLGVATSLPELSSSISLAKMNNFNASVGNITGSCCFNFIILCFGDLLFSKGSVYIYNQQALIFAICGIVAYILVFLSLSNKKSVMLTRILGILIIACYVASVTLSM